MEKELRIKFSQIAFEDLSDIERQLFEASKKARENAYAPYSHFNVGCAVLLENGEIITGNNQENAAYPSGLCAERVTIFHIGANYPDVKISKLFVIGGPSRLETFSTATPPCGGCRQSLLEYETKQNHPIEIYFSGLEGSVYKCNSVKDLLPFSFDASFL
jgi:cytidine deaminase